jgi:hypothetical protein
MRLMVVGKQWRLSVLVNLFGFAGLLIDSADQDGTFLSGLTEEEEDWYPPLVEIDLQEALQRVQGEFDRLTRSEWEWTRIYTDFFSRFVVNTSDSEPLSLTRGQSRHIVVHPDHSRDQSDDVSGSSSVVACFAASAFAARLLVRNSEMSRIGSVS